MDTSSTIARIAGSALAGGIGFVVGFYAGLFLILSIWGLEAAGVMFVVFTGALGSIVAGAAIAWTVASGRKWSAFLTTLGLGIVLIGVSLLFDPDAAALAIGGLLVVVVTSILVRRAPSTLWPAEHAHVRSLAVASEDGRVHQETAQGRAARSHRGHARAEDAVRPG